VGQALPELPDEIEVVQDAREGRGPLEGLAAGLAAVRDRVPAAYVSSTDVPLLHARFIHRVLAGLDDDVDVVLPEVGGFRHPLAAVYRTELADVVERLIAEDRMRPAFLFEACRVRRLDADALLADPALAALDPELDSLLNLNEPADYEAARARPAPEVTVRVFGALRRLSTLGREPALVAAATVGEAAAASGLILDGHVVAALNGDQITRDPQAPLVAGDSVSFLSADAGG
jgi:molybdopterin-guanine dinucleotide biosynthesis protein A